MTTVVNAALAGGMLAHADETDDSHPPSLKHPGCAIVPAALAMAEYAQSYGRHSCARWRSFTNLVADVARLGGYALSAAGETTCDRHSVRGAARCGSTRGPHRREVRHMLSYTSPRHRNCRTTHATRSISRKRLSSAAMPARNGATAATMVASGMTGIAMRFGDRNLFSRSGRMRIRSLPLGVSVKVRNHEHQHQAWTVGSPIQAPLDSLYIFSRSTASSGRCGESRRACLASRCTYSSQSTHGPISTCSTCLDNAARPHRTLEPPRHRAQNDPKVSRCEPRQLWATMLTGSAADRKA